MSVRELLRLIEVLELAEGMEGDVIYGTLNASKMAFTRIVRRILKCSLDHMQAFIICVSSYRLCKHSSIV